MFCYRYQECKIKLLDRDNKICIRLEKIKIPHIDILADIKIMHSVLCSMQYLSAIIQHIKIFV